MTNPPITSPAPLTAERLAELRAIAEAATPGPWHHRQAGEVSKWGEKYDWIADAPAPGRHHKIIVVRYALHGGSADYAFVAAARDALPALLADRERLEARAEAAGERIGHWVQRLEAAEAKVTARDEEIADLHVQLQDERDERQAAEARIAALEEAGRAALTQLDEAANQFAFYADEHAKKGTPEGDAKGRTNHGWALACAKAAQPLRTVLAARDGGGG